ncbi:MAG: STAS domain-containing protein [Parvularculales bacterium]
MTTQIRQQNGISILELKGKIVGTSVSELRKVLLPEVEGADAPRVLLNFENVRMIDSSGLGVLIEAHIVAKRRKGRMGAVHIGKHIKNLIVVHRLVHIFEHFDSEDDAVSALSA